MDNEFQLTEVAEVEVHELSESWEEEEWSSVASGSTSSVGRCRSRGRGRGRGSKCQIILLFCLQSLIIIATATIVDSRKQDTDSRVPARFHFYPSHDIALHQQALADQPYLAAHGKQDESWGQVAKALRDNPVLQFHVFF